jgi:hypothetical protein
VSEELSSQSRDGTSQKGRVLPELDPGYARVDERSTQDLIDFAARYGAELRYASADDPQGRRQTWDRFVDPAAPASRPHYALFLAFLELLGRTRGEINSLTGRHLDFFYREVLRMVRKPAVPDQVHVLAELDSRTAQLALPAGTALNAGKDSAGRDLKYVTERELIASRVEVARLASLYADIRFTDIQSASRQYRQAGTKDQAFMAMMKIALGQPNPGDPLPLDLTATPPVYPGVPPATLPANAEVDIGMLRQAQKLVDLVEKGLGMPLFDDFRDLMRLKRRREAQDAKDWGEINAILDQAAAARYKAKPASKAPAKIEGADFDANLRAALDLSEDEYKKLYHGLPEVKSIEDAEAHFKREDVQAFIQPPPDAKPLRNHLYLGLEQFQALMQLKKPMDNQWAQIDRLLEEGARFRSRNPELELSRETRALRNVDDKLAPAGLGLSAGDYKFEGKLEAYAQALARLADYFFMPVEDFKYLMSVAAQGAAADDWAWSWDKVNEILLRAHRQMIYARRRAALMRAAEPDAKGKIADPVKGLGAMLARALGEPVAAGEEVQKVKLLKAAPEDLSYLLALAEKREPQPGQEVDWKRVTGVLEVAQRNRENFQDPVPEKVEWRNLYPAADAKSVAPRAAVAQDGAAPRWEAFGAAEPEPAEAKPPAPVFGWAMTSPLLALSEGTRKVTLQLAFDAASFDADAVGKLLAPGGGASATFNPFRLEVSTAKGWLEPEGVKLTWAEPKMDGYPPVPNLDMSKLRSLAFEFTLAKGQPALAPLARDVHGIDTAAPVLRLMMRPVWSNTTSCFVVASYGVLRRARLMRMRLEVSATGLQELFIRNDESVLDPKKPFEPFGPSPVSGARFYVGHREAVAKKLDKLTFNVEWMGAPPDFATHYDNYPETKPTKDNVKATVALMVEDGTRKSFTAGELVLFSGAAAKSVTPPPPDKQGVPERALTGAGDVRDWNRYFVWELGTPDLKHSVYSAVALQKSLELAAVVANNSIAEAAKRKEVKASDYQVKPPYTPKIKTLSLDYGASAEVALDFAPGARAVRAFHVQPFGFAELGAEEGQPGSPFLPQFDHQGELYIGLRKVAAPQNLSLLFQVAEGSANPDARPEPVKWSYLSANRWLPMDDGSLREDGTRGLINSGIVSLALKPVQPSTLMPGDLYWIRAAIARSTDSVCDLVEVHPNAVVAVFADDGNAADHLSAPLPPDGIKGPLTPIPGVARILQPYTSFGGRMAEADSSFHVRVSERLRHKQRALTPWDYERLVLEKFPQLYKVKCLPRGPGQIELVIIPDIRNRLPFNPFEPKAPANLLRDVEEFMRDKTPPFVTVTARNAHYIPVKVRCGVRFVAGADEGYCRRRLNEELNRFLSPWAYDEGADLVIGGSVYANSIIDFIDRRDYVEYLAEFKLFTQPDPSGPFVPLPETEGYHASARRPDGVLVAAQEHQFDVITDARFRIEDFSGINYMRIELDFRVS